MVNIENAADADVAGLINPLLHCYQNCVFNVNVWALPAVEVCSPPATPLKCQSCHAYRLSHCLDVPHLLAECSV